MNAIEIVKSSYEFITPNELNNKTRMIILKKIELCGRACYKSEDRITDDSAPKFVKQLVLRGHEAMLEHAFVTIRFTVDRGISHELVRHRMASYAQESTRYCNYAKHPMQFIDIQCEDKYMDVIADVYIACCKAYNKLIEQGMAPQLARCVLPNGLKTEVVQTLNFRELRHMLKLRTAKDAHPQMREVMVPLLNELKDWIPEIFFDI